MTSAGHVSRARRITREDRHSEEERSENLERERRDGDKGISEEGHKLRRSSEPLKLTGVHPPKIQPGRVKKKKSEVPPFWQTEISPILTQLSQVPTSPPEPGAVRVAVDKLYDRLRERDCLGRTGGAAGVKQRSAVLRVVFSLLDNTDPSLLMKLANIIIAVSKKVLYTLTYM